MSNSTPARKAKTRAIRPASNTPLLHRIGKSVVLLVVGIPLALFAFRLLVIVIAGFLQILPILAALAGLVFVGWLLKILWKWVRH